MESIPVVLMRKPKRWKAFLLLPSAPEQSGRPICQPISFLQLYSGPPLLPSVPGARRADRGVARAPRARAFPAVRAWPLAFRAHAFRVRRALSLSARRAHAFRVRRALAFRAHAFRVRRALAFRAHAFRVRRALSSR